MCVWAKRGRAFKFCRETKIKQSFGLRNLLRIFTAASSQNPTSGVWRVGRNACEIETKARGRGGAALRKEEVAFGNHSPQLLLLRSVGSPHLLDRLGRAAQCREPVMAQVTAFDLNKENEDYNQYWYSSRTIEKIVEAVVAVNGRTAFLSTPSLYFSLPPHMREKSSVFEVSSEAMHQLLFHYILLRNANSWPRIAP